MIIRTSRKPSAKVDSNAAGAGNTRFRDWSLPSADDGSRPGVPRVCGHVPGFDQRALRSDPSGYRDQGRVARAVAATPDRTGPMSLPGAALFCSGLIDGFNRPVLLQNYP
jgi:hypothetical protein